MKNLWIAALALVLCAACSSTPKYNFSAYDGPQKNWTTSSGGYVKIVKGIPLYTQYPSRPYELIGAVVVDSEKELARAAKYYHADAALIYRHTTGVDGSVTFVSPLWLSFPITETRITAQLLRFKP
jgi:hypothetical protein